jgi:starch synthase
MTEPLRIALVATEASPLARSTGRADVVAAVARSLAGRGHEVTLFLPAYRDLAFPEGTRREAVLPELDVPAADDGPDEPAGLVRVTLPGEPYAILLVQHRGDRRWFERPGLWVDPTTGEPYPDNAARYAFFGRAVLAALVALDSKPDLLHAWDPRAAWAPAYLKRAYADDGHFTRTASAITAFDLNDLETARPADLAALGLVHDANEPWARAGATADERVPFLKVGLRLADALVLPSPRFAVEAREDRTVAPALMAVLAARGRDTFGIVHGIDAQSFDPATDPALVARYDERDLSGKARCRNAVAERAGWATDPAESTYGWPIVGMIARFSDEQGMALVRTALPRLLALPMRLFVLGLGDPEHNAFLAVMARRHPDRLFARLAFDDRTARELLAGADAFLLPARREASARQALRALRYGAVPIAHTTGALADVVADHDSEASTGHGFRFEGHTEDHLVGALERAIDAYKRPHEWRRLTRAAMTFDGSWERTAAEYETVYLEVRRRLEARRFGAWALGIARG